MNLSKKAITVVIITATVSLVGLTWVQYKWLYESITTNRKIFFQKVDLVSGVISHAYDKNPYLLQDIVQDIVDTEGLSTSTDGRIRQLIDTALSVYNIQASYTYGIYEHGDNPEDEFQFVAGTSIDQGLLSSACSPNDRQYGWSNLTCGTPAGEIASYHLGIFFPGVNGYLLSHTINGPLVTSIFFICLLIGSFAYTVLTLRKQKKLSEMKNDFINNLTHEFKTPIFSIDLAAGMLKRATEIQSSERLTKYIDVIDNEGKRLKSQVDKVLQMALVDSGNFKLEKKELDLHELLRSVSKNFELLVKERQGNLRLNLTAQKSRLFADETHLKNIIYNLMDNAQKYTEGAPDIELGTYDTPEGLVLSVRDNGIGMSEHVQKFIFDKFYRASTGNVHNVKGFGLGLSYVKRVVEAHQGNIHLQSSPNQGSIFTVKFPMA